MAQGGSLYVEVQEAIKKELVKWFPIESWINDLAPKDEEKEEDAANHGNKELPAKKWKCKCRKSKGGKWRSSCLIGCTPWSY